MRYSLATSSEFSRHARRPIPWWIGESSADEASRARKFGAKLAALGHMDATWVSRTAFADARTLRQMALNSFRGSHRNRETQWDIGVSRQGLEKALSSSGRHGNAHLHAIAALPALISNAILLESRPPRRTYPGLIGIHRLYAAAVLSPGRFFRVRITIKETTVGYRFYDQSLAQIAQSPGFDGALLRGVEDSRSNPVEPVGHGAAISAAVGITGPANLRVTIAQLFDGAKYDDDSPIWPETGNACDAVASG